MSYIVYKVHATEDKNSPVIAEGVRKDICNKLDIDEDYFRVMSSEKSNILAKKYYVEKYTSDEKPEFIGVKAKKKKQLQNAKQKSEFEKHVEVVEMMLNIYGNTAVSKNPKRLTKRLEKDGYFVNVEYRPKRVVKAIDNVTMPDIWNEIWILKLIKKEDKHV